MKTVAPIRHLCLFLVAQGVYVQPSSSSEGGSISSAAPAADTAKQFELIDRLEGLTDHVYGIAFSPDGERVAAGDTDGFAAVWSFPEGKKLAGFSAALEEDEDVSLFHAMVFNEAGTLLFAGDDLGRVHVWDIASGETKKVIRAHGQAVNGTRIWDVNGMDLSPDGKTLATCGSDGKVKLWNVPSGDAIATILAHRRSLARVVFAPDGRTLIVGDVDGRLQEIPVEGGKPLAKPLRARGDSDTSGLTVDASGKYVISQGYRGPTRIRSRPGLENVRAFGPPKGNDGRVAYRGNDLALHPDGMLLASAYRHSNADHGLVVLWDVTTGAELKRFELFFAVADNVRFSPDGNYLIAAGGDTRVAVFGRKEIQDAANSGDEPKGPGAGSK